MTDEDVLALSIEDLEIAIKTHVFQHPGQYVSRAWIKNTWVNAEAWIPHYAGEPR